MSARVRRISVDKITFRGESKGLPEIRALKSPIHCPKDPGAFGNLVRDFRDICPSESFRFPTKRDIKLSFTIETHNTVETCSIQEHEGKGVRLTVECIPDLIIHIFALPPQPRTLL